MASDVIPEYNYIEAKEIPKLPITLSSFLPPPDDYVITAARREIPYMIATEYKNGHYNTTFNWESIERVLRSIERFKAVKYKRVVKGARLTFLQTNKDLGKNIAAVATKSKGLIRINPTFNFARNLAYCDRVCFHENFHLTGSSNHTNPGDPRPLMHPCMVVISILCYLLMKHTLVCILGYHQKDSVQHRIYCLVSQV
jgi:hypothetical protein